MSSNMHLITAEVHTYAQCIQMLWNKYFRLLPDGEHDFTEVQRLIWATLVRKLLQDTMADIRDGEIVVMSHQSRVTVLTDHRTESQRAVSWLEEVRALEGHVFLFEDFFDFRDWQAPREMKFVECWTTTSPKEHLLIPANKVDFYYRARRPSAS